MTRRPMAQTYSWHLCPSPDFFDTEDAMRPPLTQSLAAHSLCCVTITLLVIFGALPIGAAAQQLTCSPAPLQFRNLVVG